MLGSFFFQAWRDLDSATPTGKGPFHNNKLVCGAASEALALVFETGSLQKFWNEESGLSPSYSQMQQSLIAHLLKKVNCPYKNLRTETNADKIRNVVRYFEFSCPGRIFSGQGESTNVIIVVSNNSLLFLKRFLADGFKKHMELQLLLTGDDFYAIRFMYCHEPPT